MLLMEFEKKIELSIIPNKVFKSPLRNFSIHHQLKISFQFFQRLDQRLIKPIKQLQYPKIWM